MAKATSDIRAELRHYVDEHIGIVPYIPAGGSLGNGLFSAPVQKIQPRTLGETIQIREFNFADYWDPNNDGFCDDDLQKFWDDGEDFARAIAVTNIENAVQWTRQKVVMTVPKGKYRIRKQQVIPEFVSPRVLGTMYVQPGADFSNNPYLPAFVFAPYSHCDRLDLQCNWYEGNTQHQTSGVVIGKTWMITAMTIKDGGKGYAVNDTIDWPNISIYTNGAYVRAQGHVTAVDSTGKVTGMSVANAGIYSQRPARQASVFTQIATSGNGVGCTMIPTWMPDFSSGSYQPGPFVFGNWDIGDIGVFGSGLGFDGTYGPQRAIWLNTGNAVINSLTAGGGSLYGIYYTGYDTTVNFMNTVLAYVSHFNNSNGFTCGKFVSDSTQQNVIVLQGAQYSRYTGSAFWVEGNNAYSGGGLGPIQGSPGNAFVIKDQGGVKTFNCDIDMMTENMGNHAGNANLLNMDYADNCTVRLRASNKQQDGTVAPGAIAKFASFGSHNSNNNWVEGQIDGITGSIFTGTSATWGVRVWDASIPSGNGAGGLVPLLAGWALDNDIYEITASGAPVNGTAGTGFGKAGPGSRYTDISLGKLYVNTNTKASPTWTAQA